MRLISLSTLIFCLAGPAFADWFKVAPAEALSKWRLNVERLEATAPFANPKCGTRELATYCNSQVTKAVQLQMVETPGGATHEAISGYFNGQAPGAVVQVSVTYDPAIGQPADGTITDALCVAAMMTFRPRLSPEAALKLYLTGMRRAVNAAPSSRGGLGRWIDKGKPASLMIEADHYSIRCVVSADDLTHLNP